MYTECPYACVRACVSGYACIFVFTDGSLVLADDGDDAAAADGGASDERVEVGLCRITGISLCMP